MVNARNCPNTELPQSYEIVSVEKAKPTPDTEGSDWYGYVISYEGAESIQGYRQGSRTAVTTAIEEIVAQLNKRHLGQFSKPGRVHLVLTPKNKG